MSNLASQHDMQRFAGARAAAEAHAWEATRRGMEAELARLAAILLREGAARVWVFGSLIGGRLHARSDIDLAVSGLPEARYFAVLGELNCRSRWPVDLVALESAPASLREHIAVTGRELALAPEPTSDTAPAPHGH